MAAANRVTVNSAVTALCSLVKIVITEARVHKTDRNPVGSMQIVMCAPMQTVAVQTLEISALVMQSVRASLETHASTMYQKIHRVRQSVSSLVVVMASFQLNVEKHVMMAIQQTTTVVVAAAR